MDEAGAAPASDVSLAKLAVPPLPPCHVPRPSRDSRLRTCLNWRIVLVAAPVGQGKTTLMSEWYRRMQAESAEGGGAVAWLSLDERDADPVRLWRHVLAALVILWPDASALDSLAAGECAGQEPFLARLSNCLFQHVAGAEMPATLFLDDVDALGEAGLCRLLGFLSTAAPASLRVVASAPSASAVPTGCCREDILCLFPSDELLFSPDETRALWEKLRGVPPNAAEAARVQALADGWAAGIRLCASSPGWVGTLSSQGEPGIVDLPDSIDRYFSALVAERVPDDLSSFLLETSIVDRFCPALCDRVAGRADSRAVVETLMRRGLPVKRAGADASGSWYAYQPLFLRWLRGRLLQLRQSQIRELNHRASEWFEAAAAPDLAAKHLLMASDIDLVEQLAQSAHFARPEGSGDFLLWAGALPAAELSRDPLLSLLVTWAYVLCGRSRNALAWLDVFLGVLKERSALGQVGAEQQRAAALMAEHVRIKCREFDGRYAEAIEAYRGLLEEDEGMSRSLRCVVVHALGESHERVGAFDRAQECYLESEAIAEMAGLTFFVTFSRYEHGWVLAARGELLQVQERCYLALRDCPVDYTLFGALHSLLAHVQLGMDRLDEAKVSIRRALKHLSSGRNADMLVEAKAVQACCLAAEGDLDAAHKVILQTVLGAEGDALPRSMLLFAYAMQARIELARNNLAGVISAHRHLAAALDAADVQYVVTAALIEARILGFQGHPAEAVERAEAACRAAGEHGLGSLQVEALLFQVAAHYEAGRKARAFALLNEALMLASGQGSVRVFLREGAPVRDALHEVTNIRKTSNCVRSYAKTVLAAFGRAGMQLDASTDTGSSRVPALAPLTPREQEVLDLLNAGMSRKEIADELGVSLNTVKTHLNNVYAKLGVDNRIDAFRLVGGKGRA